MVGGIDLALDLGDDIRIIEKIYSHSMDSMGSTSIGLCWPRFPLLRTR